MRFVAVLGLLAVGCNALWGDSATPNPQNCVVTPDACTIGQVCNVITEVCEDDETPEPPQTYPQSCAELRASRPDAADGEYQLYLGGAAEKPFTAYCQDMAAGQTPTEYLTLTSTEQSNYSQYTAGGASPGTSVRTAYQRVRFDPARLLVDISDQRFASSTGMLLHSGREPITSVVYATARDCVAAQSTAGVARVDLSGTPFAVAPDAFNLVGFMPSGAATYSQHDKVVTLVAGGFCGAINPKVPTGGTAGSFTLPLVYSTESCSDGVRNGDEVGTDCGGSCPVCVVLKTTSWTAAGPGTTSITPGRSAADSVAFHYNLTGTVVYSEQTWTFSGAAATTQRLDLDWNYTGFHAYFLVTASAAAFADGPSGRQSVPLYSGTAGGGWNASGRASLDLNAGYPYGFVIKGSNFDSNAILDGTLTLTQL